MYVGSQILVAPPLILGVADVLLRDGSRALTANWDAGSFQIRAETLQSDVATGTAPLVVASTTVVTNLNADLLDGNHAAAFALASHNHAASHITSGTLAHERGGLETDISAITTGGILRGTAAGTLGVLTVGTDGQVLTVQPDGTVAWEDAIGGAVDSLELKASVKAATTANITLSGAQTIDNVSCVEGDRVLVKDQTDPTENGIYVVDDYGAWTRASDYAAGASAAATFGHVQQGAVNLQKKWKCIANDDNGDIGTDNLFYYMSDTTLTFPQHRYVLTSNQAITFFDADPDPISGSEIYRLRVILKQDGTGGRTVTWPANVKWPGGTVPTLTATAHAVDVFEFEFSPEDSSYFGRTYGLDMQ